MTWIEWLRSKLGLNPTPEEVAEELADEALVGDTSPTWEPHTLAEAIAADADLASLAALGNHAGIAAALREPHATETAWCRTERKTFVAWCMAAGLWTRLLALRLTSVTEETRDLHAAAQTVLDLRADCLDWLDMRLPVISQMADAFVAAQMLTSDQKTEMLALGTRKAWCWEVAGLFTAPTTDDVSEALAPPAEGG